MPARKIPIASYLLILVLLWAILAQASGSATRTSLTIDEGLHITSGYTILRAGDFRLVEEHPPLVKVWAAIPLLAVPDLPDPRALPPWEKAAQPTTESLPLLQMTQQWLYPYQPIDRLVFPARAMVALLAVLLGAVVFRWAADLGGWQVGLLALFLLAFDPNILAHAAVAGTDLGAACFITLALFALARFLRRPTFPRLAFAGVTLGLAQGAKLSALILLPVVALLCLLALRRRRLLSLALIFLIAGLTFWGLYGFEIGSVPGIPFPLPAASHAIPWLRLRQHMTHGHSAFLLGENSTQGWWYYFPVAFLLKTPLPTLLLLIVSVIPNPKSQIPNLQSTIRRWGPLVLFPLLYGASSLFSNLNIGYRHLLPILPSLFIFISRLTLDVSRITHHASRITHYASRITFYALLLWLTIGTVSLSPHYLAYFNELAGGPDGGYRYLADSNTDWGQAYKDLARFQRERELGTVHLSAFIFYDPAIYGVVYEPLTPMRGDTPAVFPSRFDPPPGDYVISATTLDGIPLADPEMYDWFRKHEPDARIAHALFYYHVPGREPEPTWLAQCIAPATPLSPEAAVEGFGRTDLRMLAFDCMQSWLYPDGGESAGWYVLHREAVLGEDDFIHRRLSPARLRFDQKTPRDTPPLTVFEWGGGKAPIPRSGKVWAAPVEWPPEQALAEGTPVSAPVPLDGPLTFLGYETQQEEQTVTLLTYWRVTERPDRPFSLMGHMVGGDGIPVAVGDGLGVSWDQLQPGDMLVQRHALAVPPGLPGGTCWLQTGAYWLDTLERWGIVNGDRLLLTSVEIP